MQTFIDMQVSPETRRAYAQDLRRWQAFSEGRELTFDTVVAFRDHLSQTLAPASAGRCFSVVRSFYRWLVQTGQADRNLFDAIKGPRRTKAATPKVPSDDEVDRLMTAAREHNPRNALVVALLLNGLRAAEVGRLTWGDLQLAPSASGEQRLYMRVVGKGERERRVPCTTEVINALPPAGDPDSHIVLDMWDKPITNKGVAHVVYDMAAKAGVKGIHPHSLRHHYATRLIRAGANVMQVRDLLGHTSVATTQVYVTLDLSDLFEAAALDPRGGQAPVNPVIEEVA